MIYDHMECRTFLQEEFDRRCAKNSAYSMRAFAAQIGLAPSTLSEVLRGKKAISANMAFQIASNLGLKEKESDYFCALAQFATVKDPDVRGALQERLRAMNPARQTWDLSLDAFRIISDWYHLPMLEMTSLDEPLTAEGASRALGISLAEAQGAIDRLMRLELIALEERGRIYRTKGRNITQSASPDAGLRRFHKQMIGKALESIETQTSAEKFVGSETFPFDPESLPEAKEIFEEFFNKMLQLGRKKRGKRAVYHLGVQLFRLTAPVHPQGDKK